jgi:hypothetical protein
VAKEFCRGSRQHLGPSFIRKTGQPVHDLLELIPDSRFASSSRCLEDWSQKEVDKSTLLLSVRLQSLKVGWTESSQGTLPPYVAQPMLVNLDTIRSPQTQVPGTGIALHAPYSKKDTSIKLYDVLTNPAESCTIPELGIHISNRFFSGHQSCVHPSPSMVCLLAESGWCCHCRLASSFSPSTLSQVVSGRLVPASEEQQEEGEDRKGKKIKRDTYRPSTKLPCLVTRYLVTEGAHLINNKYKGFYRQIISALNDAFRASGPDLDEYLVRLKTGLS